MVGGFSSPFGEADLHGIVDCRLDLDRQAEVMRRLKSHPAERARIEAWREQNELLRATFSEVEREPLPVSLNLVPPPRLRCVASDGFSKPAEPLPEKRTLGAKLRGRKRVIGLFALTASLLLAFAWLVPSHDPTGAPSALTTASAEDEVAASAVSALSREPVVTGAYAGHEPPTMVIPDLSEAGFGFTSATLQSSEPPTLVFLYGDQAAERVSVAVTRVDRHETVKPGVPFQAGRAIVWRRHGQIFALAGTIEARRLSAIAMDLQASQEAGYRPD